MFKSFKSFLFLALRPGRFVIGPLVASGALGLVARLAGVQVWATIAMAVLLTALVLAVVAGVRLQRRFDSRPIIVFLSPQVKEELLADAHGKLTGRALFAYLPLKNEPYYSTREAIAEKLMAELTFHPRNIVPSFAIDGRWGSHAKQQVRADIFEPIREETIDLRPGEKAALDIAIKYQEDKSCYGYNSTSQRGNDRNPSWEMADASYAVHVLITGIMVRQEQWLELTNYGQGQGLHVILSDPPCYAASDTARSRARAKLSLPRMHRSA